MPNQDYSPPLWMGDCIARAGWVKNRQFAQRRQRKGKSGMKASSLSPAESSDPGTGIRQFRGRLSMDQLFELTKIGR